MTRRKTPDVPEPLARIVTGPEQAECLLQAGLGSAFAIARGSVEQLQARAPGLGAEQARVVHQRASALAVLAARHYREQRLTAAQGGENPWRTGLRALVDGPTFESQFSPSWGDNCTPDAIEATTSPAAYLTALYQWVTEVIEPQADPAKAIPLALRRPDLPGLLLDNQSLSQVVPTIGLVNEILEGSVRKHLDDHNLRERSVDDALLEARYPFALPFERYMSQINRILGRKNQGLGDLVRQLDPAFPYFSQGGLHSQRSDDALQMDLLVGPEQRALLLEAPYFSRGARRLSARSVQTRVSPRTLLREPAYAAQSSFYLRHYGVQDKSALLDLTAFCQRTGLDRAGVESLLSIETCTPMASPNVAGLAPASPARFGAVYINAGLEPALGISSSNGEHRLVNATDDHFDRIQRMVRLSRWLDLPFDETDRIIDAALQAEHGEAGRGATISENTLRALGLFRRLRRDYRVSAEDFAALLGGLAVYGRGIEGAQFDRVFNDPTLFSQPLLLDDSAFSIVPDSEAEYRKILHLCGALGIGYETYLYVARYIVQVQPDPQRAWSGENDTLQWSHGVISAFYRLTRVAAWIGLSSIEVIGLLQLMGQRGHHYVSRLLVPTLVIHQHSDLSDTLSVVQAITDAVRWCTDNDVSVSWLYQRLMPLAPLATATEQQRDLLGQIHGSVMPSLITEASFVEAGVPMVAGVDVQVDIDWFTQLQMFISTQGLVRDLGDQETSETFETQLNERIEKVIDDFELSNGPDVLVRVSRLVMDARAAQQNLVCESLSNTFGGSAELSRELLVWAGGTSYQLLDEVLRIHEAVLPSRLPATNIDVMADVLALLVRLGERAAIVEAFALSPLVVRSYLRHPHWFGIDPGTRSGGLPIVEVDFHQLHVLAQYCHLLAFVRQPEQVVLDYLALVNGLPPDLSEPDLQLIREDAAGKIAAFTGIGIRDTLDIARQVTRDGIVVSVPQLEHLVRVREACKSLQLGCSAVIALSRLLGNSPRGEYLQAAWGAMSSLNASQVQGAAQDQSEQGQSETCWIVTDRESVVARTSEKARCLLVLKDFFDRPLPGISVSWDTDLGELGSPSSGSTDEHGRVEIDLAAGEQMGTAQVVARFGLGREVRAPLITIDCDADSLRFIDPVCSPWEALAGNLQEISYRVQLLDQYGNPGRDRVLQWNTDLGQFIRPQTRADADGLVTAQLRSLSSGTARVVARLEHNGKEELFHAVEFLDQPYFRYVRFSGPVATTQPVAVTCQIVNLDGSPVVAATVHWSASLGGFVEPSASSQTDAEGIASISFVSEEAGQTRITVAAEVDGQSLVKLASGLVTVHPLPEIAHSEPEHQYYALQQRWPAGFSVTLTPPMSGSPVQWWLRDALLATNNTDIEGTAKYHHHFSAAQLGQHTVIARTLKADDTADFDIDVVQPHSRVEFSSASEQDGLVPLPDDSTGFIVNRRATASLVIRVVNDGGGGDGSAQLTASWHEGASPDDLKIVFDPPLGQALDCDEEGVATLKIDGSRAYYLANSDLHDNTFTLLVKTNLEVTGHVTLSLRDVIDLSGCEMKFAQMTGSDVGGISGYLQRADGFPLQLREAHRTVRASTDGDESHGVDAQIQITNDDQQRAYVIFRSLNVLPEHTHHCSFFLQGHLAKRLYLVGTNTREFKESERLTDLAVSFDLEGHDRIVEYEHGLYIDVGQRSILKAYISNAGVPVSGVGWFVPRQAFYSAAFTAPKGLSDSQGCQEWHVDTDGLMLSGANNNEYSITAGLGPFDGTFIFAARQFCRMLNGFARVSQISDSPRVRLEYGFEFERLAGNFGAGLLVFLGRTRIGTLDFPFRIDFSPSPSLSYRNQVDLDPDDLSDNTLYVTVVGSRDFLIGSNSIPMDVESKEAP